MSDILSPSIVIDACTDACKSMKMISKQLITFSSIYSRTPPSHVDSETPGIFSDLFSKISEIQDILNKLAVNTQMSIEPSNMIEFPKNIVLSQNEYIILYNVFIEYSNNLIN